jgi:hypothetical protein
MYAIDVSIMTICVVAPSMMLRQEPGGKSEFELLPNAPRMRTPGEMRSVALPEFRAQKYNERHRKTHGLRNRRCQSRSGDAPAQCEYEEGIQRHIGERRDGRDQRRDARAANAIEEAEHRPQRHAAGSAAQARQPEAAREIDDLGAKTEGREEPSARGGHCQEQRHGTQDAPQRGPRGLRRAPVTPSAVRLRHERLHSHRNSAQQHDEDEDQPLHRADRGEGLHGDVANEPNVRQIQNDLHGAVCDQRQRKRQHRGQIHVRGARGVDALRGQTP